MKTDNLFKKQEAIEFIKQHRIKENEYMEMDDGGRLYKSAYCGVVMRECVSGVSFEIESKELAEKIQKLIYKHYNK